MQLRQSYIVADILNSDVFFWGVSKVVKNVKFNQISFHCKKKKGYIRNHCNIIKRKQ